MTQRSLLLAAPAGVVPALLFFAGCGGAAAPAPEAVAPAAAHADDVSTPEGAAAAVDRAERTLDQLLGPRVSSTITQQAAAPPFAVAPEPPPPPPPPPPPTASVAPEARPGLPSDRGGASKKDAQASAPMGEGPRAPVAPAALDACSTACSALASMARAADHLCSLAGAADARCTSARTRVHAATARVHASCPACGV